MKQLKKEDSEAMELVLMIIKILLPFEAKLRKRVLSTIAVYYGGF